MNDLSSALLRWFDREARVLPWRAAPDNAALRRDPYAVVLSEFMLQQTQVAAVISYFLRFMERFPAIGALAEADETEVLKFWEGLGYYSRARNLHKLAKQIVSDHGGILPREREALLKLPGIGPYTAGAIRTFAYNIPDTAVDGNLVRVVARLEAAPYVKGESRSISEVSGRVRALLPADRPGDFNEALMDLGATICTPKNPSCAVCPVSDFCRAYALGKQTDFPLSAKKMPKPVSEFTYVALCSGGRVFVRRRGPGLLSGLYEFFSVPQMYGIEDKNVLEEEIWSSVISNVEQKHPIVETDGLSDIRLYWRGRKRHVFSHRIWECSFWDAVVMPCEIFSSGKDGIWVTRDELAALPFSAFLVPWRDALLKKMHGSSERSGEEWKYACRRF